jgi:hypothetical protein
MPIGEKWHLGDILCSLRLVDIQVLGSLSSLEKVNEEILGNVLVHRGFIDEAQLAATRRVVDLSTGAGDLNPENLEQLLFASIAVEKGLLKEPHLREALEHRAESEKQGPKKELMDVLLEKGTFPTTAFGDVLTAKKDILKPRTSRCPGCGIRFSMSAFREGMRIRCKKCRRIFLIGKGFEPRIPSEPSEKTPAREAPADRAGTPPDGPSDFDAESGVFTEGPPPESPPTLEVPKVGGPAPADDEARTVPPEDVDFVPPSQVDPAGPVKEFLGKYMVLGEIARGGMGIVFHARDLQTFQEVAIKVLIAGEAATKNQLSRFQREIRNMQKLSHPGIVKILEVGEYQGRQYYTMEYLSGGSLKKIIREEDVSARRAAQILLEVAGAVSYAHTEGVVHRDLKPENILLNDHGQFKVADFGLAKDLGKDALLTREGSALGTPAYVPPEQAQGKVREMDHRSDIYSLGAILYELLTGKPPFTGGSRLEVLVRVVDQEPRPPRQVNRRVPAELQAVCLKAMAKRKRDRYQVLEDFRADLRRFLAGRAVEAKGGTLARRVRSSAARKANFILGGLAAGAVIAGTILGFLFPMGQDVSGKKEENKAHLFKAMALYAAGRDADGARLLRGVEASEAEKAEAAAGREWRDFLLAMRGGEKECRAFLETYTGRAQGERSRRYAETVRKRLSELLDEARLRTAMDRAQALLSAGKWAQARDALGKILENLPASTLARKGKVKAQAQLRAEEAMGRARTAFQEKKDAEALDKVNEALLHVPGREDAEELKERIRDRMKGEGTGGN